MHNNKIDAVVSDIIDGVRQALVKHEVTFEQYRAGIKHMMETAKAGEIPLLLDVFLNTTVADIEQSQRKGSQNTIEGPYFREGAPDITDGVLPIRDGDKNHEPIVLRGRVTDTLGRPVADAVIDVWHSTPDGRYSGFHDNIPFGYYRGKVRTRTDGRYQVRSIVPAPYQIPNKGPTGALLEMMGRHSWRPAHVHYKLRKDGFLPLTTQAYFEGGDYVDSDSCSGVRDDLVVAPKSEDGVIVMEVDFVMDVAVEMAIAS